MNYYLNKLLLLAGICDSVLGIITIGENILLGIIVLLSGILTVLIGCLTAAFLSHIAEHDKKKVDTKKLEELILELKKELKKNA